MFRRIVSMIIVVSFVLTSTLYGMPMERKTDTLRAMSLGVVPQVSEGMESFPNPVLPSIASDLQSFTQQELEELYSAQQDKDWFRMQGVQPQLKSTFLKMVEDKWQAFLAKNRAEGKPEIKPPFDLSDDPNAPNAQEFLYTRALAELTNLTEAGKLETGHLGRFDEASEISTAGIREFLNILFSYDPNKMYNDFFLSLLVKAEAEFLQSVHKKQVEKIDAAIAKYGGIDNFVEKIRQEWGEEQVTIVEVMYTRGAGKKMTLRDIIEFNRTHIVKLVGGEVRPHTARFVEEEARILAAEGITVITMENYTDTTTIYMYSFLTNLLGACGATYYSSSHSANYLCGRKVLAPDGSQLLPDEYEAYRNILRRIIVDEIYGKGSYAIKMARADDPNIMRVLTYENMINLYHSILRISKEDIEVINEATQKGHRMGLNCLNGSTWKTFKPLLEKLGIDTRVYDDPALGNLLMSQEVPYFNAGYIVTRYLDTSEQGKSIMKSAQESGVKITVICESKDIFEKRVLPFLAESKIDIRNATLVLGKPKEGVAELRINDKVVIANNAYGVDHLGIDTTRADVARTIPYPKMLKRLPTGSYTQMPDPDSDRFVIGQIMEKNEATMRLIEEFGISYYDLGDNRVLIVPSPNKTFLSLDIIDFEHLVKTGQWNNYWSLYFTTYVSAQAWTEWSEAIKGIIHILCLVGYKNLTALQRKIEDWYFNRPGEYEFTITDQVGRKVTIDRSRKVRVHSKQEESGGRVGGTAEPCINLQGKWTLAMPEKSFADSALTHLLFASNTYLENKQNKKKAMEGKYLFLDFFKNAFSRYNLVSKIDRRLDLIHGDQGRIALMPFAEQKTAMARIATIKNNFNNFWFSIGRAVRDGKININRAREILSAVLPEYQETWQCLSSITMTEEPLAGDKTRPEGVPMLFEARAGLTPIVTKQAFRPSGTDPFTSKDYLDAIKLTSKQEEALKEYLMRLTEYNLYEVLKHFGVESVYSEPEDIGTVGLRTLNLTTGLTSSNNTPTTTKSFPTDLTGKIGIETIFNPENLSITYGPDVTYKNAWSKTLGGNVMSGDALWKSLKFAIEHTDDQGNVTSQPDLKQYYDPPDKVLYFGHQGAYWDNADLLKLLEQQNLRPDVTCLPAGTIGEEYIRTEGHHHLSGLPEVYETVYGRNGYLLFKTTSKQASDDGKDPSTYSEDIEDVMFVFAEEGDHVIFPPGYQHISVNIGVAPFIMTDWVSTKAEADFRYIKRHNGAPYWVVKGADGKPQFIRNPRYKGRVPPIRLVRPALEIPEFGLRKGEPMFNLVRDGQIGSLDFLNNPGKYKDVFKRAFVPYEQDTATKSFPAMSRESIQQLAYEAANNPDAQLREQAQDSILKSSVLMGVALSSIKNLYRSKKDLERSLGKQFTLPSMNLRCAAFDEARIIFETAKRLKVGVFQIEIAPTEVAYTGQNLKEYAISVVAAAIAAGYTGPVFLKLDHMRMDPKKYDENPDAEIQRVFSIIKEAIDAGFYAIDIDASVLEKDPKEVLDPVEQQRDNFIVSAQLVEMTRAYANEKGIDVALGVEVGEVGEAYIKEEHIRAFLSNLKNILESRSAELGWNIEMPDVLAIPSGTPHGGLRDPKTGEALKDVTIAFDLLEKAAVICGEYGMVGPVQHGASKLPIRLFDMFSPRGVTEIHLATAMSDIEIDKILPDEVREQMLNEFAASAAAKKAQDARTTQKKEPLSPEALRKNTERRKLIGKYKADFWNVPVERKALREKLLGELFSEWFKLLGTENTLDSIYTMYPNPNRWLTQEEVLPTNINTIYVMTGGGDAAGLNDIIARLIEVFHTINCNVVGIPNALKGAEAKNFEDILIRMTITNVPKLKGAASTYIGSAREDPFKEKSEAKLEQVIKNLAGALLTDTGGEVTVDDILKGVFITKSGHELNAKYVLQKANADIAKGILYDKNGQEVSIKEMDNATLLTAKGKVTGMKKPFKALIITGGDDHATIAWKLSLIGIKPVIVLVKTIDNDVSAQAIGAHTAVREAIRTVLSNATSSITHQRSSVYRIQGRHAGFLALGAGDIKPKGNLPKQLRTKVIRCAPSMFTLIPEKPASLESIFREQIRRMLIKFKDILGNETELGSSNVTISEGFVILDDDPLLYKLFELDPSLISKYKTQKTDELGNRVLTELSVSQFIWGILNNYAEEIAEFIGDKELIEKVQYVKSKGYLKSVRHIAPEHIFRGLEPDQFDSGMAKNIAELAFEQVQQDSSGVAIVLSKGKQQKRTNYRIVSAAEAIPFQSVTDVYSDDYLKEHGVFWKELTPEDGILQLKQWAKLLATSKNKDVTEKADSVIRKWQNQDAKSFPSADAGAKAFPTDISTTSTPTVAGFEGLANEDYNADINAALQPPRANSFSRKVTIPYAKDNRVYRTAEGRCNFRQHMREVLEHIEENVLTVVFGKDFEGGKQLVKRGSTDANMGWTDMIRERHPEGMKFLLRQEQLTQEGISALMRGDYKSYARCLREYAETRTNTSKAWLSLVLAARRGEKGLPNWVYARWVNIRDNPAEYKNFLDLFDQFDRGEADPATWDLYAPGEIGKAIEATIDFHRRTNQVVVIFPLGAGGFGTVCGVAGENRQAIEQFLTEQRIPQLISPEDKAAGKQGLSTADAEDLVSDRGAYATGRHTLSFWVAAKADVDGVIIKGVEGWNEAPILKNKGISLQLPKELPWVLVNKNTLEVVPLRDDENVDNTKYGDEWVVARNWDLDFDWKTYFRPDMPILSEQNLKLVNERIEKNGFKEVFPELWKWAHANNKKIFISAPARWLDTLGSSWDLKDFRLSGTPEGDLRLEMLPACNAIPSEFRLEIEVSTISDPNVVEYAAEQYFSGIHRVNPNKVIHVAEAKDIPAGFDGLAFVRHPNPEQAARRIELLHNKEKNLPALFARLFGISGGIKFSCSKMSFVPRQGGMESSNIFADSILAIFNMFSGANFSVAELSHISLLAQINECNNITGNQGADAAWAGAGLHIYLGGLYDMKAKRNFAAVRFNTLGQAQQSALLYETEYPVWGVNQYAVPTSKQGIQLTDEQLTVLDEASTMLSPETSLSLRKATLIFLPFQESKTAHRSLGREQIEIDVALLQEGKEKDLALRLWHDIEERNLIIAELRELGMQSRLDETRLTPRARETMLVRVNGQEISLAELINQISGRVHADLSRRIPDNLNAPPAKSFPDKDITQSDITAPILHVNVAATEDLMGKLAAEKWFDEFLKWLEQNQKQGHDYVVWNAAAAPSQFTFYKHLVGILRERGLKDHKDENYYAGRIRGVHLDEYMLQDKNHPGSFKALLIEHFVSKFKKGVVDFKFMLDMTSEEYMRYIESLGGVDIATVGVGDDEPHMGFNSPNGPGTDNIREGVVRVPVKSARQQVTDAPDLWNPEGLPVEEAVKNVPQQAWTMTVKTILSAKSIIFIAPGAQKAKMLYLTLKSEPTPDVPSAYIKTHPDVYMFADMNSAELILQDGDMLANPLIKITGAITQLEVLTPRQEIEQRIKIELLLSAA